ncbi:MAG: hypothetical protein WAN65_18175 [Candidatus Sulfotelmatobacter sp.]
MTSESDNLTQNALRARRENRLEDAKRDLVRAVGICRESGLRNELAKALAGLGQIERDLGCSDVAMRHYEEAGAIYRTEGEALKLAHMVRHVADIQRHEGHYDQAAANYGEALRLYRSDTATSRLDLANALRGMALLKEEIDKNEEARSLWSEARDLYAAVGVEAGVSESSDRLRRPQD